MGNTMENKIHSDLANALNDKRKRAKYLITDIERVKFWFHNHFYTDDSHDWKNKLNELRLYRELYNELATEIRDIKKKIKEVNRKNYETF